MRRAGGGAIVNTSSTYGLKGVWGYAAYVASKTALIGITKTTAVQYASENIRANAICPSAVNTPMLEEEQELFAENPHFDFDEWLNSTHPMPRVAEPEEVSRMVLYLVSPAAAWVTGSVFSIDGGFMAK